MPFHSTRQRKKVMSDLRRKHGIRTLRSAYRVGAEGALRMDDINEVTTTADLRSKVAENVAFLLRREGVIGRDDSVVIPVGADNWTTEDWNLHYSAGFHVFAKDGNTEKMRGEVSGFGGVSGTPEGEKRGEVVLNEIEVTLKGAE